MRFPPSVQRYWKGWEPLAPAGKMEGSGDEAARRDRSRAPALAAVRSLPTCATSRCTLRSLPRSAVVAAGRLAISLVALGRQAAMHSTAWRAILRRLSTTVNSIACCFSHRSFARRVGSGTRIFTGRGGRCRRRSAHHAASTTAPESPTIEAKQATIVTALTSSWQAARDLAPRG